MSSETKKVLEDAYIADGAYCGCKQGQYVQPVTATHSDTVKMQGLKIMTCDDNVLMKNVIDFGMCNFYGDCKLKEKIGQKINWENYKNDVKIKGSKALNGASYFRCPYAPTEIINFYDHQQNILDEDGTLRAKTEEEKKEEAKENFDNTMNYLGKSFMQVVKGEFTKDEDRTILGSVAEVALGFTGFDILMDVRDMVACAKKGDWLGFGMSAIGALPLIGGGIKAINAIRKGGKAIDEIANIAKNAKKWAKSLKPTEMAKDFVKNGKETAEAIGEAGKMAYRGVKGGVKGIIQSVKYMKKIGEAGDIRKLADDILAAKKKIVVAGKESIPKIKAKICEVKTSLGFDGCFSEGTLIKTEKGYTRIEEIEKGEMIYSYNLFTEEIELKPVLEVLKTYEQGNTLKLIFENETEIETTFTHEFMTEFGEWIEAKELEVGEKVYTMTGEVKELKAKEIIQNYKAKIMYDLEIEENHNYYVSEDDILVHNESCAEKIENIKKITGMEIDEVEKFKKYSDDVLENLKKAEKNGVNIKGKYSEKPKVNKADKIKVASETSVIDEAGEVSRAYGMNNTGKGRAEYNKSEEIKYPSKEFKKRNLNDPGKYPNVTKNDIHAEIESMEGLVVDGIDFSNRDIVTELDFMENFKSKYGRTPCGFCQVSVAEYAKQAGANSITVVTPDGIFFWHNSFENAKLINLDYLK